jgi:hypothetical protein
MGEACLPQAGLNQGQTRTVVIKFNVFALLAKHSPLP